MEYHGIHVALCTPFRAGGKAVDHRRLRALVNDQIRNGIHGLIPGGSTGEFPALTTDERRAVTETVCDAAKGRVPVRSLFGQNPALGRQLARTDPAASVKEMMTSTSSPTRTRSAETSIVALVDSSARLGKPRANRTSHGATNTAASGRPAKTAMRAPGTVTRAATRNR